MGTLGGDPSAQCLEALWQGPYGVGRHCYAFSLRSKGLDFILAEAGKYGIKVTLVLLNQWKKNNGVRTFEEW